MHSICDHPLHRFILHFDKKKIKIYKYFLRPFKNFIMLWDTQAAFSHPVAHAHRGAMTACWACNKHNLYMLNPVLVEIWKTSYWNLKHRCSLCRCGITAEVKRQCKCPEEWTATLVWLNPYVIANINSSMYCGSCVMYMGLYSICVQNCNWKLT